MTDTLTCDTVLLRTFQDSGAFDYGRELHMPEKSLMEWIIDTIGGFISDLLDDTLGSDNARPLLACAAVVLFVFVLYLLYRYKPGLFGREGKSTLEYTVSGDTIYGIDFDAMIARALADRNYSEAVRMVYLQTLRWLSDNNRINWQIYKTPTQYIKEVDTPPFREFTDVFVRVRYGNSAAGEDTVSAMRQLQRRIEEGGVE